MDKSIASYARVSTQEQNLDRQRKANTEYIQSNFDVELGDIQFYSDKSTGTNINREDYRQLMEDIANGEIDIVVVKDLTRLARSLQDLQRTVERIVDENKCEIHFIEEGLTFTGEDDPFAEFQMNILGAVAEFQARLRQQSSREGLQARMENDEDYRHGPAPLGYAKDDGHLYEKEYYPRVKEVLQQVTNDELSKRKAAEQLDTSRATIRRAIENRPELYGINS